jgi:hypothetical protein
MGEDSNQQVIALEQNRPISWKRRTAVKVLGESRARAVAGEITRLRAFGERTMSAEGRTNNAYLRSLKNIHAGKRCVIIGNGPSLNKTDLGLLGNEVTFGLNRIYLMFDKLGFETTFHVVVNRLVVEQCADDFRRIKAPLFTTMRNMDLLGTAPTVGFLSDLAGPRFSTNIAAGIWQGSTVTYVAMQIAYYMGFSEVILVGVDHRFAVNGPNHQLVVSDGPDASHFDPNYFGKGFKWELPNLDASEVAYRLARAAFEKDGRRIVDATVDGALTVFPKMPLAEALGR